LVRELPSAGVYFSYDFTADSSSTTLTFSDVGSNQTISLDGILYNPSVTSDW